MIIFALVALVLVGFVALAVDTGFLMSERRQAQSAADAGALAAATDVLRNKSLAVVQNAGKSYGAENADVAQDNVVINWPPASGEYAGNLKYVEAIVSKDVEKFFVGALYDGDWEVTARAVAGVEPEPRPYALLALSAPGIYINGSTKLYVDGGSAMSNSNILGSGGSNVFFADGSIDASGTISGNPSWYAGAGMNPGASAIPDPLEDANAPTTTGDPALPASCSSTCTFLPGNYHNRGTITISGTATFQKGIYVFSGNTKLNLQNSGSQLIGEGVLFYFTGSASFDPKNGGIRLTAPCLTAATQIATCSGEAAYAGGVNGMTLWIANCTTFDSQGSAMFEVEGVIYAPCSHVELHGNPAGVGIQVIVGDLVIKGTSDFLINYREYVKMDKPRVWLTE